jgi:cell wall-associated NlpC family hydrolase
MADDPIAYQVTAGICPVRKEPRDDAPQDTQALPGEVFLVEREDSGWGYGRTALDDYPGWVDMAALSAPALIPTHQVKALRTYVFSEPHVKSAPVCLASLNAKIVGGRREGKYIEAQRMGWVFAGHLRAVGDPPEPDWVAVAERFLGAPYQWGGKESLGLDCSGLIQTSMEAADMFCPRDSGPQEAWAKETWTEIVSGADVAVSDEAFPVLKRGDLVFWPGHVGVMTDPETLLHANGFHMSVAAEPLAKAAKRIEYQFAPMSGIYRRP